MSDIAIRVENLGKKYRIGGRQERYKRFTETVMDTLTTPIRRLKNLGKPVPPQEIIWALKGVSFEVERGEVLGIIGRNGAGKTTLLKYLSRITEPTEGRAEIHGRVGSLLEVGTGFHPELTGRENVYLNGAILGMHRAEIDAKFDEIVDFAEIEKFLDTPAKRYSSGMYVRLAFAVAAHLEPEILLVDEVLAVGDVAFQKKCLGKMGEVSKEGRTVLFVSHNMGAVQLLCPTSTLLNEGRTQFMGSTRETIQEYLATSITRAGDLRERGAKVLYKLQFINESGEVTDTIQAGEGGRFRIHYQTDHTVKEAHFSLSINTIWGVKIASLTTAFSLRQPIRQLSGKGYVDCLLESVALVPGKYHINVALHTVESHHRAIDHIVGASELFVLESDWLGTTTMASQDAGFVLIKHKWVLGPSGEYNH